MQVVEQQRYGLVLGDGEDQFSERKGAAPQPIAPRGEVRLHVVRTRQRRIERDERTGRLRRDAASATTGGQSRHEFTREREGDLARAKIGAQVRHARLTRPKPGLHILEQPRLPQSGRRNDMDVRGTPVA